MTVTKVTVGLGVVVLGFLCWMAAAGFTALTALLVSGAVLVVLVAGGNWIGGRSTPSTSAVVHAPEDGALPATSVPATAAVPAATAVPPGSEITSVEVSSPSTPDAGHRPGSADGGGESGPGHSSIEAPDPGTS